MKKVRDDSPRVASTRCAVLIMNAPFLPLCTGLNIPKSRRGSLLNQPTEEPLFMWTQSALLRAEKAGLAGHTYYAVFQPGLVQGCHPPGLYYS